MGVEQKHSPNEGTKPVVEPSRKLVQLATAREEHTAGIYNQYKLPMEQRLSSSILERKGLLSNRSREAGIEMASGAVMQLLSGTGYCLHCTYFIQK